MYKPAIEENIEGVEEIIVLNSLTTSELKEICKDRGLTGYSSLNKAQLIEFLMIEKD